MNARVPNRVAYDACVEYIHLNPVAARLVGAQSDYPFSSAGTLVDMDPMRDWFGKAQG